MNFNLKTKTQASIYLYYSEIKSDKNIFLFTLVYSKNI